MLENVTAMFTCILTCFAYRYLYWTDFGDTPRIERSFLDGSSRVVLHSERLYWPAGLTLDLENKLMYWSDNKLHVVERSRLDGSQRSLVYAVDLQHPFAMSVFEGNLYWADWHSRSIQVNSQWSSLQPARTIVSGELFPPRDVKVVHPLRQAQCEF